MMSNVPKLRFKEFIDVWERKSLNNYLFEHKERNYDAKFDKNNVLSVSGEYGVLNQIEHLGRSYAGKSVLNYHIVRKNDIVYTKSPLKANPYGIIKTNKGADGIVSTLYAVYRCKNNVNNYFLDYYFSLDDHLNKYLRPLVQKGAKNDMKINNQKVLIDPISIPSKQEQEKIASFLTSVDLKITQLKRKAELLQQYKRALLQKIFSQEIKFKTDNGSEYSAWEVKKFEEVFNRITTKNKENNLNVLTISAQQGLINQEEYFNKSVSAKDVTGYYLLEKNDFAYNKSYSNGYPLGAIKRLSKYKKGIVSTLYICFRAKQDNVYFLEQLFESGVLNKEIHKIAQEGARNHGLLNISVIEFFKDIHLSIPCIEEQSKIANFLSSIDSKIEHVQKQLASTKDFKKALLQQMFV